MKVRDASFDSAQKGVLYLRLFGHIFSRVTRQDATLCTTPPCPACHLHVTTWLRCVHAADTMGMCLRCRWTNPDPCFRWHIDLHTRTTTDQLKVERACIDCLMEHKHGTTTIRSEGFVILCQPPCAASGCRASLVHLCSGLAAQELAAGC